MLVMDVVHWHHSWIGLLISSLILENAKKKAFRSVPTQGFLGCFLMIAILTGVRWNLNVILTFNPCWLKTLSIKMGISMPCCWYQLCVLSVTHIFILSLASLWMACFPVGILAPLSTNRLAYLVVTVSSLQCPSSTQAELMTACQQRLRTSLNWFIIIQ